MPGRWILTLSAGLLFLLGSAAMFAPDELARWFGDTVSSGGPIILQIAGGALLSFAILNWMSRMNRIGGIYARPIALANLLLFFSSALTLGRAAGSGLYSPALLALCTLFSAFAAAFAWLVFAHDPVG